MEGFRKLIERATAYVGVHARFVSMIRRMMHLIRDVAKEDPRLLLDAEVSGKGRVAWNNGVYDLRTQTLLPFSPDIVFFYKLEHDYPTTDEARRKVEAIVAEVREQGLDPDPKEPRVHETTRVRTYSRGSGP
jgi:Asp-tRNA(Asn)/Glu-tRNA(Gln) amidotransferase A subunit family amidase